MEYKKQKPGKRSPYNDSFRRKVVEEVLSGSIFIAAAAKKYGIPHRSTVSSWMKWYSKNNDIGIAGHRWISSTIRYRANNIEEQRELINRLHPLGNNW